MEKVPITKAQLETAGRLEILSADTSPLTKSALLRDLG